MSEQKLKSRRPRELRSSTQCVFWFNGIFLVLMVGGSTGCIILFLRKHIRAKDCDISHSFDLK